MRLTDATSHFDQIVADHESPVSPAESAGQLQTGIELAEHQH